MVNDCIQKEDEVQDSLMAKVEEVETGDGKIINDRGLQVMEKFLSFGKRNCWNLSSTCG